MATGSTAEYPLPAQRKEQLVSSQEVLLVLILTGPAIILLVLLWTALAELHEKVYKHIVGE